ncbi:MAG: ATPase, T2SS/T4P/T4SS family [Verrucomicrobiota bacterium JB022]|nr:ATPase, T2SS/T4P/T4SS family [Verrucomicrobiota bacterium JB022]
MRQNISGALRRTLLLKVISKPQPTREDVETVIELTSSRVVEALQAQSMTLYLLESDAISFKYVYYSPTLWEDEPSRQEEFSEKRQTLLKMRLPRSTGIVGKVIDSGQPFIFSRELDGDNFHSMARQTGFEIHSMLTVPLRGSDGTCVGAIQVLNKEPDADDDIFTEDDLDIVEEVAEYSTPLLQRMLDPNFQIDDRETAKFVARFTDSPLITSEAQIAIDEKLIEVTGEAIVRRTHILPYKRLSPSSVAALMTNPLDYPSRESFHTSTDLFIEEVAVAPASLIDELLRKYTGQGGAADADGQVDQAAMDSDMAEIADVIGMEYAEAQTEIVDDGGDEDSAPIIQLANRVIEDAYISGASDIHIEPQEDGVVVRYRIDGVCAEKLKLPKKVAGALVARIKVMSDLDIAEKRLPQDGRIVFKRFTKKNIDIDLRVACGPMNFGEKVVMRILDKTKSALPITMLGFSEENLKFYRECIVQPYGMILHCGPTGSGKSMTLFSALREVVSPEINIQTAEDPIEYTIPGINQMQMHKQIGLTFARALRCYLRMDPDIILVGEIRDQETAEISVEAALTGHLLLSTLHTNDAPSTIARFTDMGIEPFMISASMLVVCAQRLMRRACKSCRVEYLPEGNEAEIIAKALDGWHGKIYKAKPGGCPVCGGKGMKGRVGIHELMRNNDELTRAINRGADTAELKRIAMANGMKTLHQDSILKVKEGTSTVIEALSNVPPDLLGHTHANEEHDHELVGA